MQKERCCTFWGHRDCPESVRPGLEQTVKQLLANGVDRFYVGHQGRFDAMALGVLRKLKSQYPTMEYWVVLAHLPRPGQAAFPAEESLFPEGVEIGPPRFAVDRRNRWMLAQCGHAIIHVTRSHGGAAQWADRSRRKGLCIWKV